MADFENIFRLTDDEKAELDAEMAAKTKTQAPKPPADVTNWSSLLKMAMWLSAITAGAHPQGHVVAGQQRGIPMRVDYKNFVEDWDVPKQPTYRVRPNELTGRADVSFGRPTWRDIADTHAAGFRGGDILTELFPQDRNLQIANALYKLFYPTAQRTFTGESGGGDIGYLQKVTGNKAVPAMMGVDVLSDLFFDKPDQRLTFETRGGIPSLLYKRKF